MIKKFNYGRTIENINKTGNSLNICFKRYLAEYEGETEINKTGLYKNSPYYFENKGTSNYDSYASIYGSIKNRDSKKLKLYKTAYNHRYAKKKGLSKLDCYYENKIFKKIDHLYDIAYNWRGDKKSFKKKIMKVFGTRLILFALLPCLGLILLILFGSKDIGRGILKVCSGTDETHVGDSATCDGIHNFITQDTLNYIQYTNFVFSLLMVIIVILFFTYILLKVIKYEKLEEGKGKMNKKQYINYCKEVFNLK
ncbi:hypothetical protein PVNG_05783 [Plasmodium vivax North Korean]|uniref:Variable surface protein n=1 Tax=Plasmodium vivax North Korean TaxID=1035514 RepID=A0A0J9U385_PLAVI|nr:hypothetical protein PVNG_05783 [Plasmodium vivax North Korean]